MTAVANHPSRCSLGVIVNVPMMSARTAIRIITAMIGTATTPFSIADQSSALIGSIGAKSMPMPMAVASVMMP